MKRKSFLMTLLGAFFVPKLFADKLEPKESFSNTSSAPIGTYFIDIGGSIPPLPANKIRRKKCITQQN